MHYLEEDVLTDNDDENNELDDKPSDEEDNQIIETYTHPHPFLEG